MGSASKTPVIVNVKTDKVTERAWNRLASENYIETNLLRQEIALSWERCLQNNVDPLNNKGNSINPDIQGMAEQYREFLDVAKPHMQKLYERVKGMGFVVILTDAEGIILDIFGDRKMFSLSESLSLVPGASCSENAIGTTSPGVCLIGKNPIQVFSREHYCQLYHNWCCSSAPIFDNQRNLIGVLDLSNVNEKLHHPLILGLVDTTAKAIEMELNFRRLHTGFNKSSHYFKAIVDSIPEALLFFDIHGTVTHINNNATKILGVSSQGYVGHQIDSIVKNHEKIKHQLEKNMSWTELQFNTPKGLVCVNAHFKPIKDSNFENIGAVCTLKELKRTSEYGNDAVYTFEDMVFCSDKMKEVVQKAQNVSFRDTTILIQGESGTGKEIMAQAIHNNSPRRSNPFIAVNCAALPKDLIQSELFGYEEGTFTGAKKGGKAGKFELANGGTIFLDEIGDMPFPVQANLLRVLQEKHITRVGGYRTIPLDVRVIAATNKDLLMEVDAGRFRKDLFYRLSVMVLSIPPLRNRKEDIEVLWQHFVSKHSSSYEDAGSIRISPQVMKIFAAYDWPGNVRELENTLIYLLNNMEGKGRAVTAKDLPSSMSCCGEDVPQGLKTLDETERQAIIETLSLCNNNISQTSSILGVTRATLYRKIKRYKIII